MIANQDATRERLISDLKRPEQTAKEQLRIIEQLLELGDSRRRIAEACNRDPATISQILRVLKLPEDLQRRVGEELTVSSVQKMLKVSGPARTRLFKTLKMHDGYIDESTLSKYIRGSGGVEPRRFHEIRDYLKRFLRDPKRQKSRSTKEVCRALLRYAEGKATERQTTIVLNKIRWESNS